MVACICGHTHLKKKRSMKNSNPPLVNFPRLHEELTTGRKPENTVFLAPALSLTDDSRMHKDFIDTVQSQFPVPLQEAKRNARLLQEYGADLWESKQLAALSVMSQTQISSKHKEAAELKEIKNFIASQVKKGKVASPTPASPKASASGSASGSGGSSARTAQDTGHEASRAINKANETNRTSQTSGADKTGETDATGEIIVGKELTLCIAYDLEQAVIETKSALKKLGQANANFMTSLHDTEDDVTPYETITTLENFTDSASIHLSYRSILEAMLPFLPQDALLFTNDTDVLDSFQESGLFECYPSEPLHGQEAFHLTSVPAWKMLGLKEPNPKLPWTGRTLTLCYPAH